MIFEVNTNQTDYVFANNLSELLKGYAELSEQNGFTEIDIIEISDEHASAISLQFESDNRICTLAELANDCKEFTILVEVEY